MIEVAGRKIRITHYRIPDQMDASAMVSDGERLKANEENLRKEFPEENAIGVSYVRSIDQLRKDGKPLSEVSNKGGLTVAEVVEIDGEDEKILARGEAWCRPDESFNKKLGRMVAVGRALKQLRENKPAL